MEAIFSNARTLVRTYCLIKTKETVSKKNLWYSSNIVSYGSNYSFITLVLFETKDAFYLAVQIVTPLQLIIKRPEKTCPFPIENDFLSLIL